MEESWTAYINHQLVIRSRAKAEHDLVTVREIEKGLRRQEIAIEDKPGGITEWHRLIYSD